MNDIDLEVLRQKALETLFKSSSHDSPHEIENIPESHPDLPSVKQKICDDDPPSKLSPSKISPDRPENKLPPLVQVRSNNSPSAKVKCSRARRSPFIIQIGDSSSEEDSNENKQTFMSKNRLYKNVDSRNAIGQVTRKETIIKEPFVKNNSSSRLAAINKEMLRRKGHYLKSKLSVYKLKEVLAKKKEFRHQVLSDIKSQRIKLKLLTSKYKSYNKDIASDERKLKTLEQALKSEENRFNTYCDAVRSFIDITKRKTDTKTKMNAMRELNLVELLGRVSVSCLHHTYFKIDFDYILSVSKDTDSPQSPSACYSETEPNKTSDLGLTAAPSVKKHPEDSVESKESLIAKSIVSNLVKFPEDTSLKTVVRNIDEIHSEDTQTNSHCSLNNAISSETSSLDRSETIGSNCNCENKELQVVQKNSNATIREPLKDTQNPILKTSFKQSSSQSDMNETFAIESPRSKLKINLSPSANIKIASSKDNDYCVSKSHSASKPMLHTDDSSPDKTSGFNIVDMAFENLSSGSTNRLTNNVNAIVCPFILDGVCLDEDCEFEHPAYLTNATQTASKNASCGTAPELKSSGHSLFDPVLFQISQPLNLVSHLDCSACSTKISISTHHLIEDAHCASCCDALVQSNYAFDVFTNLLHHLHFRISRKTSRGEDVKSLITKILDIYKYYCNENITLPDSVLKHCLLSLSFQTKGFADQCLNLLKDNDFPAEVCLFALDLCKDYPSKRNIMMQCLLYSKSTENAELLNHLLLVYCRLEYMAGRTKQAQSFLFDSIKGFSNGLPSPEQISELYFTVRLYLDWVLHDYLPFSFQTYRPFLLKTLLEHEKIILFLFNCLFPGLLESPIEILRSIDSLSFNPHLVYLFQVLIDFLRAKGRIDTALTIATTLISSFGLKSFLCCFCYMAFKKSSEFSSPALLKAYFKDEEIVEKIYPAAVYFNSVLLIKQRNVDKTIEILEAFSFWLFRELPYSLSPFYLYKYILQIDDSLLLYPLKPRFSLSHPRLRKCMNYIWLNYALYGCLLGIHEEISYQLHNVCAMHLLPHDDLHVIVHFLLKLLATTVCKTQPLYYCKMAEKLCFYAVPNELENCSDYFNSEIAELAQQIKLSELTFNQRNEFCTNLIEKRSFNLPLIMSLVKSLIAISNSQDYYLAFSLCQAASFDNPKYEEFWLLYLALSRLNKMSEEVINVLLSKSVICLPESRRLWAAYYSFSIQSGKTKLQKSLKNELKKTGLFQ